MMNSEKVRAVEAGLPTGFPIREGASSLEAAPVVWVAVDVDEVVGVDPPPPPPPPEVLEGWKNWLGSEYVNRSMSVVIGISKACEVPQEERIRLAYR